MTDNPAHADGPWTCPGCNERIGNTFDACWNCGTTREGEPLSAFHTAVEPPLNCPECGYLLHGLTGNRCPECGAPIGTEARDTPQAPPPKQLNRLDRTRRIYLWTWLASWTIVPLIMLGLAGVLSPLIQDEDAGLATFFFLLLVWLGLAVASPVLFFFSLLPDQSHKDRV